MNTKLLSFLLLASMCLVKCDHLILGDPNNKQLIYHIVAEYSAYPFLKRTKDVFYSNPEQRIISTILAYDNLQSKATATVTAGGVGYSFVNIRMDSERGKGLEYDIGIYS
ncbi:uncharacterized protein LOC106136395 [Amyelois transitella]|uniref:uncharacterized protein LOC106136395 n=1 Tax=Amyelois transitella TaxID=680683 RepID=UPI00067BB55D|nr:uncharacterized protein LOC106136395 [Amyelois transitella]